MYSLEKLSKRQQKNLFVFFKWKEKKYSKILKNKEKRKK